MKAWSGFLERVNPEYRQVLFPAAPPLMPALQEVVFSQHAQMCDVSFGLKKGRIPRKIEKILFIVYAPR